MQDPLPFDIVLELARHLTNKLTLMLLRTCRLYNKQRKNIRLYEHTNLIPDHMTKWYYDNLVDVHADVNRIPRLPSRCLIVSLFNRVSHSVEPGYIPPTVSHLRMDNDFDRDLTGILPANLKVLKTGRRFCRSLVGLPEGLKYLKLGNQFKESLEGVPSSLKILETGLLFNNSLEHLPQGLETLNLSNCLYFNHPIISFSNLTRLMLPREYKGEISALPQLRYLRTSKLFDNLSELCPRLRKLMLENFVSLITVKSIPRQLVEIYIDGAETIEAGALPNSLRAVAISNCHNVEIPKRVRNLSLINYHDGFETVLIPPTVINLCLYRSKMKAGTIPPSVKYLRTIYCDVDESSVPPGIRWENRLK